MPVDLDLIHPDFILCIDETRFNLNSRDDGNAGRESHAGSANGAKFAKASIENDCRATAMGFANLMGKPILRAAIIKATNIAVKIAEIIKSRNHQFKLIPHTQ